MSNASKITVFNDFIIGDSIPIEIDIKDPSYHNSLELWVKGRNIKSWDNVTDTSLTLSFNEAEIDNMYNALSETNNAQAYLRITTYTSQHKIVGGTPENNGRATAKIDPNLKPTFEPDVQFDTMFDNAVKGATLVRCFINDAEPTRGASIKKYKITCNNYTSNEWRLFFKPHWVGTTNVVFELTDSRNRKTTKTLSFETIDHFLPKLHSIEMNRCNPDGTLNYTGLHLKVHIKAEASSIIHDGSEYNKLNVKIKYRVKGGSSYVTRHEGQYPINMDEDIIFYGTEPHNAYDIRVEISDQLAYSTAYTNRTNYDLGKAKITLWLGDENIGVGKFIQHGDKYSIETAKGILIPSLDLGSGAITKECLTGVFSDSHKKNIMEWVNTDLTGYGDFDDIVQVGNYTFRRNAIIKNWSNRPCDDAGWVAVRTLDRNTELQSTTNYLHHTYTTYKGVIYTRTGSGTVGNIIWTGWSEVWQDSNSPANNSTNGYQKFASGVMIQWGVGTKNGCC